jgi:alcohol dehydrogenase (cytochrome c)
MNCRRIGLRRAVGLSAAALVMTTTLASASATTGALADVGWGGFGNTPNENRHSPLTQVSRTNVDQLGRVFTLDFHQLDANVRRGEQSYPVVAGGTMYMTTNDDNVWALDATTGKVKWRWQPDDVAVFRNFGIVANRGVALCDGHVFVLTLDMTIASIDPATGRLERRVPIAKAVPGAAPNYGYSETSAPICANHHLIVGAAGSEYGVRGFVMAYKTDLTPAWPNPFWTIPPEQTSWRSLSRIVGGGVVWTPTTVDTRTNTLYFGTGSGTPLYYPALRPGSNPRSDSLIAVDLATGRLRWWQQQMAHNEWSYDTAQPPLVYDAQVGGRRRRIVSVGTMEGVWFAYDAASGQPIYERVRVIDRTEHPSLQPGKPVAVFPSSIGGLNYSPASYDPHTNFIFNAAAETAAIDIQTKLSPTQKLRKRTAGDVFLGLENGNFGTILPGWHDHGSISAIDVNSGRQVWKLVTPEPERGGVTTTESGLGFAGGGDGVLRAFDLRSGKVLWSFQTGHQIASGPSLYSVNGKEYIAITVGGTPTSSGGGTATELQVYALGASATQSPPPKLVFQRRAPLGGPAVVAVTPSAPATRVRQRAGPALGRIVTQSGLVVQPWDPNSSNEQDVVGHVLLRGKPVAGAQVSVDGYLIPQRTAGDGSFHYLVDDTVARRHVARIASLAGATVAGRPLTPAEKAGMATAAGGFSVAYPISGLSAKVRADGSVLVGGRLHDARGNTVPTVALYTYQLGGKITDAAGKPVQGAVVITRTQDRDFWRFSSASDANGQYLSFFSASDETAADPVPLSVGVAYGATSYGGVTGTIANFPRLQNAVLNIQLGPGSRYTLEKPSSYPGAVYSGLVVGAAGPGGVIRPLLERWPDLRGVFSMVLPRSARGKTISLWENQRQFYSRLAGRPGGPVDLGSWPVQLGEAAASPVATLRLP